MSEEKQNRPAKMCLGHRVLRGVLFLVAILTLAASGWAMYVLIDSIRPGMATVEWISPVMMGVVGLFFALMLLVGASLVRSASLAAQRAKAAAPHDDLRPALDRLEQSLRLLNTMQSRPEGARAMESLPGPLNGTGRPLHVLEQVRDLTLMDPEQRKRYAAKHWAHRKRAHLEAIERDVLVGDWVSAFARLEELEIVLPDDPQVIELKERVESEQSSRLEEDVRVARGRLKQLMSAALWQQAEELAGGLQEKYPGKAEADRLADDVRRERDNWERENMERLFRDISAANDKRQWRHAAQAVEEFIRRYPLDPRAEALRLDLPTLQENAAAHERKEQEEHFKDLFKRQRYDEALVVARGMIQKYPHSPLATELNKLLPRVEEMAKQEAAKAATGGGAVQTAAQTPAAV